MKPRDATLIIETAYRIDLPAEAWLKAITESACGALGSTQGGLAFLYDASGGDWVHVGMMGIHDLSPEFARDFFNQPDMPRQAVLDLVRIFTSMRFGSIRDFMERHGLPEFSNVLDRYGVQDFIGINGWILPVVDACWRSSIAGIVDPLGR